MAKYVYSFGAGQAEGQAGMRELLGSKGANLAEMTNLGIPVPPGFTISTEACIEYFRLGKAFPPGMWEEVEVQVGWLEGLIGTRLGDGDKPLLVSVRSGARVSMPGMMDTVLNLGLNDHSVKGLAERSGNPRFAYDSYRRFLQMFGNVVLGIEHQRFEEILEAEKSSLKLVQDTDLDASQWQHVVDRYKELILKEGGKPLPQDATVQLRLAIAAVFESWNTPRAITYRRIHHIPEDWGTAANIQAMVFGNMGNTSGTGVAFTRDPSNGENRFFGEFLINAQGEDVVAGIRTPRPICELEQTLPQVYGELVEIYKRLEQRYRDMQDIEFTIQDGHLYLLQTRTGKRTAAAAVRMAVEMVEEGLIDKTTALLRIDPAQLDQILHPTVDPKASYQVIARGLAASPGAAVGRVVFRAQDAEAYAKNGERVILVRLETSPEDIGGMNAAQGVLTARGGMTSHAAVVARGMGKCCVTGCAEIQVDEAGRLFTAREVTVQEGDHITLNGSSGEVILGKVRLVQPEMGRDFATLLHWADEVRALRVRANADTPHDAQVARDFGAEGIGLCRTEHMFFREDRLAAVRQMILALTAEERQLALEKILPMQRSDFREIFKVMKGLPVTIRLLDPPLHEFLPHTEEEMEDLAREMGISTDQVKVKVKGLKEVNPMLGHRGCRLGITYPEIYAMQARAIFEATAELVGEGYPLVPEVMIPLVGDEVELALTRQTVVQVAEEIMAREGRRFGYLVGTMIELPRAALTADRIACHADFFSFGTNDLTQTVYGLSRDDAGTFLPQYLEQGIFRRDPFIAIDQDGVGELMKIAVEKGRRTRPDLKIGICGEHGGEPTSVEFCHRLKLDYVSCSPFRVPIACLAAAQATLKDAQP